jgi:flagellar biosynthesis chaperone FliJ
MKLRQWLTVGFYVLAVVGLGVALSLWRIENAQVKRLEAQTQTLMAFTNEKDSLTQSLATATRSINDVYSQMINVSGEVSSQAAANQADNSNYKAQIADKLQRISSLVGAYQNQMSSTGQRLTTLKQQNASRAEQLKGLETTVEQLNATLETQQKRVDELLTELNSTKTERDKFASESQEKAEAFKTQARELATLATSFSALNSNYNTVYVATGAVEDLFRKGIIIKTSVGFPFAGTVWQPATTIADSAALTAQFRRLDMRRDNTIPIPFASYTFLSPHNIRHTQRITDSTGSPAIKIVNPEQFWAQSRYLIITGQ